MQHVAFMQSKEEKHRGKAIAAFEAAVAASEVVKASLFTEYASFLLNTRQLDQAYTYLQQAVASGDSESELSYGVLEKATVLPLLQAKIDQDKEVEVRGIDYAFYLLIHHYEAFQQAGISLRKTRAAYLATYEQGIRQRAGKPGEDKQDEVACYLLSRLQEELASVRLKTISIDK